MDLADVTTDGIQKITKFESLIAELRMDMPKPSLCAGGAPNPCR